MNDRDVVIVEAVRTAVGRRNGSLSGYHPVNLLADTLKELMKRSGQSADVVEDVVSGCVSQVGEQGINVGRNALLTAGFPYTVPGTTVDRQCGSSQQAIHFAANLIQSGVCDVTIGCGVENMTRVPMGVSVSNGPGFPFPQELLGQYSLTSQGVSADTIAKQWGISRKDVDEYAVGSQMKAAQAREEGRFDREIMPLKVELEGVETTFAQDEGIRPDSNFEKLATLQPSFGEDGVHTAGNSSQISDGAAAVLMMSAKKAEELGAEAARADRRRRRSSGSDPVLMLTGPITATPKVLDKAGLKLDRHRQLRDQRGVRVSRPRVGEGAYAGHAQGERQRRRDRAGPPARLHGREADDDAPARARAHGRPLRTRDDVLRRRPRHRDDHRAAGLTLAGRGSWSRVAAKIAAQRPGTVATVDVIIAIAAGP